MVILGRLVISILYDIVCVGVCALSSSDWYVVEVHSSLCQTLAKS